MEVRTKTVYQEFRDLGKYYGKAVEDGRLKDTFYNEIFMSPNTPYFTLSANPKMLHEIRVKMGEYWISPENRLPDYQNIHLPRASASASTPATGEATSTGESGA